MDYKFIIVDDDTSVRSITGRFIQHLVPLIVKQSSVSVSHAANGDEALSVFYDLNPHVALIDTDMPGTIGYEVLRMLQPDFPNTYFIGMSGSPSYADKWAEVCTKVYLDD